jgi:hypothetical protein
MIQKCIFSPSPQYMQCPQEHHEMVTMRSPFYSQNGHHVENVYFSFQIETTGVSRCFTLGDAQFQPFQKHMYSPPLTRALYRYTTANSGLWNIYRFNISTNQVEYIFAVEAEIGGPAWSLGDSHYGGDVHHEIRSNFIVENLPQLWLLKHSFSIFLFPVLDGDKIVCSFHIPGETNDKLCVLDLSIAESLPVLWSSHSSPNPALSLIENEILPARFSNNYALRAIPSFVL